MTTPESLSKARAVLLIDLPSMGHDRFNALVQRVADSLEEAEARGLSNGVKMREAAPKVKQAVWEQADGWKLMAETYGF